MNAPPAARPSAITDPSLSGRHELAKARLWEQARAQRAAGAARARAEAAFTQPAGVVVDEPVAPVVLPAPRPVAVVPAPQPKPADVDDDQELVLEDLTPDQVRDWRVRALKVHQVVFDHIDR